MNELYPLKFKPILKEKIWGGQVISGLLGTDNTNIKNCGEAWLLSGLENEQSVVTNGFLEENELSELIEIYMSDLVGDKVFDKYKNNFPLLIKLLNADDYLSVQVHPDDELAQKIGLPCGKTEMWYVMDAAPDAEIICGFNRDIDKDLFQKAIENGQIQKVLNTEHIQKGNAYFIPAGRIHALGPKSLIAEIQQSSDTTYRVYDFDRKGDDGKPRELHVAQALEALNYKSEASYKTSISEQHNTTIPVVEEPQFTVNMLNLTQGIQKDFSDIDSFVAYLCVEGSGAAEANKEIVPFGMGELILIPAMFDKVKLFPNNSMKVLEIYIA